MKYHFIQSRTEPVFGGLGWVAGLWLGLLIGVSFLATPVKFQAPSLDLPTALDVGRVTFALSIRVEWGLWILTAAAAWLGRARPASWVAILLLGACLAMQSFWLLPILDERVGRIIAGLSVESTPYHLIYVVVEGAKLLLLLALAAMSLRRSRVGGPT